jgi:hypothetical protein
MGNFYTNYTLRVTNQQAVAAALAGHKAVVTSAHDGCVVVFDEQSDEQDQKRITELASRLSREFRCAVLAVLNHDDDILWYHLYENGWLTDEYDSTPNYFNPSAEPTAPAGGNAQRLCSAFGATDVVAVERILRKSAYDENGYAFAFQRHADLVHVLGIPEFSVGTAYASFGRGEYPEGLSPNDLLSPT